MFIILRIILGQAYMTWYLEGDEAVIHLPEKSISGSGKQYFRASAGRTPKGTREYKADWHLCSNDTVTWPSQKLMIKLRHALMRATMRLIATKRNNRWFTRWFNWFRHFSPNPAIKPLFFNLGEHNFYILKFGVYIL